MIKNDFYYSYKQVISIMTSQYALDLAGYAGELLLKNGAEIFRIQDTMHRILNHCGYPNHNIYVISNGIFATVNEGEGDRCTLLRHVPLGFVHLGMISEVNRIARNLEKNILSPEMAFDALKNLPARIDKESTLLSLFSSGVGAAAFCYMLGGFPRDIPFAFLLGCLLQLFLMISDRKIPFFLTTLCGSFLVTIGSKCFTVFLPTLHFHSLVIGAIIILVPGVAFTTSIREFFNGDYLSGIIHIVNALLTAICIAAGVAMALRAISLIGGIFL